MPHPSRNRTADSHTADTTGRHAVRTLWIEPSAPPKPALGAPCNGCGLCCLAEPCPLGVLVSRRTTGACAALRWSATENRYLCGMLANPREVWPALPKVLGTPLQKLARRWIAAGVGCDADLQAQTPTGP
jgi:hypothetical protein